MTTDFTNIATRAMLVRLSVTSWTARRFDRKASEKATDASKADKEAGRFNKHLLAGAKQHADIIKAAGAARTVHYTQTLPWGDDNWRLLPTANYFTYMEAMRAVKQPWASAVSEFVDAYPRLRDESELKLGAMWNADEYPPAADVKERFTWSIEVAPVPAEGDLRVDLPADICAQLEAVSVHLLQDPVKEAMADVWQRLRDSVARIKARTTDDAEKDRRSPIRDTLIEQAREMVDVLGRLNVSRDTDLDLMRDRVLRDLAGIDVESLRTDPDLRADTAKRADAILAAMDSYFRPAKQEVA